MFHLPGDLRELRPLWSSGGGPGGCGLWIWPVQQGWRLLLLQQPGPGWARRGCEVENLKLIPSWMMFFCWTPATRWTVGFHYGVECVIFSSFDSSGGRVVFFSLMFFLILVGELNLWTWWVFSDLALKLWISRDTIPRGRVQHCCTPSREFGRISYLMGNIWLQRQLFSQKAVEACWGYKWAQEKIFLIFPSWVFLKQWDVAAGILAGLQKNWAASHLPKTVEAEVTGKTVRPQRDFGSLAQQLLGHCQRIWGAEVVCSECKMVRFL